MSRLGNALSEKTRLTFVGCGSQLDKLVVIDQLELSITENIQIQSYSSPLSFITTSYNLDSRGSGCIPEEAWEEISSSWQYFSCLVVSYERTNTYENNIIAPLNESIIYIPDIYISSIERRTNTATYKIHFQFNGNETFADMKFPEEIHFTENNLKRITNILKEIE